MEMKQESINIIEQRVKTSFNIMAESDLVVPDIKPDIRELLLADACAEVTSHEYRNGKLTVTGTVYFKALYRPEKDDDACELKSLCSEIPFSDTFEIPNGEEIKFSVSAETEHIGFTLVNSRKLAVKVLVSLTLSGYKQNHISPISTIQDEGVFLRNKQYQMYMPLADECIDFTVSDLLTVPRDMPDIDEILKADAFVTPSDIKVMLGRVMVKGLLHLQTIYQADDGKAYKIAHTVPFSEVLENEHITEGAFVHVTYDVKNISQHARGDINGDTKIISVDAHLNVRLKASGVEKVTLPDDGYSTKGTLITQKDTVTVSEFVTGEHATFVETQTISLPKDVSLSDIFCVSAKPMIKEYVFENGALKVLGSLVSFLLYRDEKADGILKSAVTETEFVWQKKVEGEHLFADGDIWIVQTDAKPNGADSVESCVQLGMYVRVLKKHTLHMLTACEMKEAEEKKERMSLVVCFSGEQDTLWDVAKRYGTTVDKIKCANGMDEKMTEDARIPSGKSLLIPCVR